MPPVAPTYPECAGGAQATFPGLSSPAIYPRVRGTDDYKDVAARIVEEGVEGKPVTRRAGCTIGVLFEVAFDVAGYRHVRGVGRIEF